MINRGMLLVAEHDGDGRIAAVWRLAEGDRTARPMQSNDIDLNSLSGADFHGGSQQDILAFIERLPKIEQTQPPLAAAN